MSVWLFDGFIVTASLLLGPSIFDDVTRVNELIHHIHGGAGFLELYRNELIDVALDLPRIPMALRHGIEPCEGVESVVLAIEW